MTDQLPKTGLRVGPAINQHGESINSKKSTITVAGREHIAAWSGQLEKAHGDGRRQEFKGRWRGKGTRDEGGEFPQGLHGRQHLWGIDVQSERTLHRLVSQESLPPMADVGTAEGQTQLGEEARALLIYELKTEHISACIQ